MINIETSALKDDAATEHASGVKSAGAGSTKTTVDEVGNSKKRQAKTKISPIAEKSEGETQSSRKFREMVLDVEEDNSFKPLIIS